MAQLIAGSTVDGRRILDTSDLAAITPRSTKGLVSLLYPSRDGGLRDIHRGGWNLPLNQQWGSHLMPLPDGSWGDTATGSIGSSGITTAFIGQTADRTYRYQIFKISKPATITAIWVKLRKVGNPTNNFSLFLYSVDGSNLPNAQLAVATAQSGVLHTSAPEGAWYRFPLSIPYAASANTSYAISCKSSGASDLSNYWGWVFQVGTIYPHGGNGYGDETPTFTYDNSLRHAFLIETSSGFLQAGGQFDCKLKGTNNPLPVDQADYLWRKMQDDSGWFDGTEGMILIRGTGWTKNATIADFLYGLNHDRIVLRCNVTTGYAQVDLYESDGTKSTVTGTTDISAAGHKDIAIAYRLKNDGADYLKLFVNGTSEGTPLTGQSFSMDANFKELGTAYLLGGFGLAPAMTQTLDMSVLPSADTPAWEYSGTATEGAHFVVSGGRLYQQIVGATDTSYYQIHPALNNANGWAVRWKSKVMKASDTTLKNEAVMYVQDGTKSVQVLQHTYYCETNLLASDFKVQIDFTKEHAMMVVGKGSDFYLYCDGALIIDGTGLLTSSDATAATITFGDGDATSGSNAEVIWDYLAYYNTAAILPEYTGGSLSEFATWSGDQSALLPFLWNSGTPVSVKEYCGVPGNYVKRVYRIERDPGVPDGGPVVNLKPVVNIEPNKLDIFAKSSGAAPDASNPIGIAIPDGSGYTFRMRSGSYLGGTSQIVMSDGVNYWSKGSVAGEIKTAWLYAIWDGTGIVWALAGYSGFTMVPTTTTATDDDYFLLEDSSTYTRDAAHYCVAVSRIRYEYDTGDTPDHTIQVGVENAPQIMWNPKSDYGYSKNLATTITTAGPLSEQSCVSLIVRQSRKYKITWCGEMYVDNYYTPVTFQLWIKTGNATYGAAAYRARAEMSFAWTSIGGSQSLMAECTVFLNAGDTIHGGAAISDGTNTTKLYGDSEGASYIGSTSLSFEATD
jgi:hypothetical protein